MESIISKPMRFSLGNLKPWKNFQINEWSSYFNKSIHQNTSIKPIRDELLIKIFKMQKITFFTF